MFCTVFIFQMSTSQIKTTDLLPPIETDETIALAKANEFSLSLPKKKKKKSTSKGENNDDLKRAPETIVDSESDYSYETLLTRAFALHQQQQRASAQVSLLEQGLKKLPPPILLRTPGKTTWINFDKLCTAMNRDQRHVQSFIMSELGVEGSIKSENRFQLKGLFQPRQIEALIKKYYHGYVICAVCKSHNTVLVRDAALRLMFVECNQCCSKTSVSNIKIGFHATSRADRRKAKT